MSLAQENNTPTRPRIEPGSPDPESDALTTRPVRPNKRYVQIEWNIHVIGRGYKALGRRKWQTNNFVNLALSNYIFTTNYSNRCFMSGTCI